MSTIAIDHEAGIAAVTIHRPAVRNALDAGTLRDLVAAVACAAGDDRVRVIVLHGDGGAFCAGDDLDEAAYASAGEFAAQIEQFQELARLLRRAPQPVIASIGGAAYGGGLELAVNCDARIAADTARFGCPEVTWGLTISNAASVLLRRLVGDGWARELVLFGRELDAAEAQRIGLVTRVVAPQELAAATDAMARTVVRAGPEAVALSKRLLNADDGAWLDEVLAAEAAAVTEAFATGEARSRLRRFAERERTP